MNPDMQAIFTFIYETAAVTGILYDRMRERALCIFSSLISSKYRCENPLRFPLIIIDDEMLLLPKKFRELKSRDLVLDFIQCIHSSMDLQPFLGGPGLFFSFVIFFTQTVRLLRRVISPSQGLYLYIGQHKYRINAHTNIHAPSKIRTYYPSVRAREDSWCLRPLGYWVYTALFSQYLLFFFFVRLLALRPLVAYCASLGCQWRWVWRSRWNVDWQGKPKLSEKNCPSATSVHHKIPHDQTQVWTRAAAVESRRLTAWAMARPSICSLVFIASNVHKLMLSPYQNV
jgi:hypothetical protein